MVKPPVSLDPCRDSIGIKHPGNLSGQFRLSGSRIGQLIGMRREPIVIVDQIRTSMTGNVA